MEKEKKPKGILRTVEFIIILVFFIAFLTWVVPKCKGEPDPLPQPESLEDTTAQSSPAIDSATTTVPPPAPTTPQPTVEVVSRLYVTIDGLNLRTLPDLNSDLIVKLPLFEEVYFLNEVTDSTQQISLGYEVADEPWVKVRTKKGHIGWVYGAGINYYKKKRPGVLE